MHNSHSTPLQHNASGTWADITVLAASAGSLFESYAVPLGQLPQLSNVPNLCFRLTAMIPSDAAGYVAAQSGSTYGTAGQCLRFFLVVIEFIFTALRPIIAK